MASEMWEPRTNLTGAVPIFGPFRNPVAYRTVSEISRASAPGAPSAPLERAFRVLQELVAAPEPIGVRELGRRCGLPSSTASRIVAQLVALGFVERGPDGRVAPGSAMATLQIDTEVRPLLRDRLRPLLVDLAVRFGEHAALSVDDGAAVTYPAQIRSDHPVSAPDVADARHPFHLVAPGLLCMAHWSSDRLADYLGQPLTAATARSMTDPAALADRVGRIARIGHAWAEEELDVGINGLAVPVFADGTLVAAISLYGPSYRFSPSLRPDAATELAAIVAERISADLAS
jgi:IclR family acetate operon transcriptional repressor